MLGAHDHRYTTRLQHRFDRFGDLHGHFLLNLQAASIGFDDPRQLADADDPLMRQISHMCSPDDGNHMMFAMADEGNITQDDHLIVTIGLAECPVQNLVRFH